MTDLVLVTGASGFIAKHVVLRLLQAGYSVRGTVRTPEKADRLRQTMAQEGCDVARLSIVEADLTSDEGWSAAAQGCRYIQHIAAAFPIKLPRNREALVPIARAGTLRVLEAAEAAGVERTVLTSSIAAMMYRPNPPQTVVLGEKDWTDPEWSKVSAYVVAKTRAELAAWEFMRAQNAEQRLTVVNPGLVYGPSLDEEIGTSLLMVELIMKGFHPALPPVAYPIVDVRDVAELHVKAMTTPGAAGRRLLATADTATLIEIAAMLRDRFPVEARRAPRLELPRFLVPLIALFETALKAVVPDVGRRTEADASYVTHLTGVRFRSAREAVEAAGECLIQYGFLDYDTPNSRRG